MRERKKLACRGQYIDDASSARKNVSLYIARSQWKLGSNAYGEASIRQGASVSTEWDSDTVFATCSACLKFGRRWYRLNVLRVERSFHGFFFDLTTAHWSQAMHRPVIQSSPATLAWGREKDLTDTVRHWSPLTVSRIKMTDLAVLMTEEWQRPSSE